MCAKLNFSAVLLLALLATGYANIPLSLRRGVNNFEDQQPTSIVPRREPNIKEISRREEDIEENEIATTESYSNENDVTEKRRNLPLIDFPSWADTESSAVRLEDRELKSYGYAGCGKVSKRFRRIVGGRSSTFGKHPWQAAVFTSDAQKDPHCGGVLISDRTVITAAHCVENKNIKNFTVRLGEHNVKELGEVLPHEDYKIEKAEVHPDYSKYLKKSDLALLKLDRTVSFKQHIIPACLPTRDLDLIGQTATVSGWGNRKFGDPTSRPAILNEVEVEIISKKLCQEWLSEEFHDQNLHDGILCAGYENGGRDACQGDSGGPLTISIDDRRVLIGVVSTGVDCGTKRKPGIYMNVWKYLPWMKEIIKKQRRLIDPR